MRKELKKIVAVTLTTALTVALTACGGSKSGGKSESKSDVYNIGICQLVEHDALDAATKGFKDALIEKLGKDILSNEELRYLRTFISKNKMSDN